MTEPQYNFLISAFRAFQILFIGFFAYKNVALFDEYVFDGFIQNIPSHILHSIVDPYSSFNPKTVIRFLLRPIVFAYRWLSYAVPTIIVSLAYVFVDIFMGIRSVVIYVSHTIGPHILHIVSYILNTALYIVQAVVDRVPGILINVQLAIAYIMQFAIGCVWSVFLYIKDLIRPVPVALQSDFPSYPPDVPPTSPLVVHNYGPLLDLQPALPSDPPSGPATILPLIPDGDQIIRFLLLPVRIFLKDVRFHVTSLVKFLAKVFEHPINTLSESYRFHVSSLGDAIAHGIELLKGRLSPIGDHVRRISANPYAGATAKFVDHSKESLLPSLRIIGNVFSTVWSVSRIGHHLGLFGRILQYAWRSFINTLPARVQEPISNAALFEILIWSLRWFAWPYTTLFHSELSRASFDVITIGILWPIMNIIFITGTLYSLMYPLPLPTVYVDGIFQEVVLCVLWVIFNIMIILTGFIAMANGILDFRHRLRYALTCFNFIRGVWNNLDDHPEWQVVAMGWRHTFLSWCMYKLAAAMYWLLQPLFPIFTPEEGAAARARDVVGTYNLYARRRVGMIFGLQPAQVDPYIVWIREHFWLP